MSDPTLIPNEKISKKCKEMISKAKKLINLKEVTNVVNNLANQITDESGHTDTPVTKDVNDFLSWMVEKDSVKKLKRELEGWREIILHLNSVLLWEKSCYPGIIAGITTVFFTVLWLLDPSLLTAVSSTGLLVTLLDYLVPTISASLYSPAHWTGAMEKQYEDICKALVHSYNVTTHQVIAFIDLKVSSPKLYYSVTIVSLALLSYIGNKINNLVLTYLLVTSLLLVPGLVHHGIVHKYYQILLQSVSKVLKGLHGGGGDKLKIK